MGRQKTLVLIKPDAVQRELIGEILSRLERKGLTVRALKMLSCSEALARQHLGSCTATGPADEQAIAGAIAYLVSAPVVAVVVSGNNAVDVVKAMAGPEDCCEARPGTIRGDLGCSQAANLLDVSSSAEEAEREIPLWFPEGVLQWIRSDQDWLDPDGGGTEAIMRSPSFARAQYDHEVALLREKFAKFDINGDGKISRREVAAAFRAVGKNPTQADIDKFMELADLDRSGFVDFDEFFMFIESITPNACEEELLESFRAFDSDNDGFISADELLRVMTSRGERMTPEEAEEMLHEADKNGDGKIDYSEFVKTLMS
eukprot:m51a1_g3238 nucleoside-diphosphate kinase/calmodulin, putative (316) ;mRNA; r:122230-123314